MDQTIEPAVDTAEDVAPAAARRDIMSRGAMLAAGGLGALLVGCGTSTDSPLINYPTPTPTASATPTPTPTPTVLPVTDTDMMVLMLQVHYLQAEFYSRAVLGRPLPAALVAGAGTLGEVSGGSTVTFADPILAQMAAEIAFEKIDQVVRLRAVLVSQAPARPALNLAVDATGAFTRYGIEAAAAATPTVPLTPVITDVYANQEAFLLRAFIFEDAAMVAWRGISALMVSATNIDVAAGLLATSSFHVGTIRRELLVRGGATGSLLRQASIRLSDLRDSFAPVDDDRGVAGTPLTNADITPADGEGEIYGRLPTFTINTFYMTQQSATSGGFFPSGLNGVLRESTQNSG